MLSISQIAIDCADAATLAAWWSQVLGRPVDDGANPFFATVGRSTADQGPVLMFLKVPEGKQVKNRLHLDLSGPDWRAEEERLIGLGAVKVSEHQEYGLEWTCFRDPEGNEFDLGSGA